MKEEQPLKHFFPPFLHLAGSLSRCSSPMAESSPEPSAEPDGGTARMRPCRWVLLVFCTLSQFLKIVICFLFSSVGMWFLRTLWLVFSHLQAGLPGMSTIICKPPRFTRPHGTCRGAQFPAQGLACDTRNP